MNLNAGIGSCLVLKAYEPALKHKQLTTVGEGAPSNPPKAHATPHSKLQLDATLTI